MAPQVEIGIGHGILYMLLRVFETRERQRRTAIHITDHRRATGDDADGPLK